jgi:AAA family ATP:ADP antiporter
VKSASLRAFGLESGEGRTAGLMSLHSFAMGLSTAFVETAASALFVTRFGPRALPWVYIAAAFVNVGAGALFEAARRRLAFRRLMAALLVFLLALVLGLRVGLALTDAAVLVFALFVFYRVLSVLTDLEYWAVAGHLYDVRQAKRLFGLVGTGEVVARILGSLAVPFLVAGFGVLNLLTLSAGALLLSVVLLLHILPAESATTLRATETRPARQEARGFAQLARDPYLRRLFALAVFSVLAKYFVDFAFLAETRTQTTDVAAFAAFFGLFSGLTQFLSLLTRIFVAAPLFTRFGVRSGLLVLPTAHVLCTAAILAAALRPEAAAVVFWLVVANQGIYKALKHPIDNPCFKVLYQPLPRNDRLSAQVAVETLVIPVTTGVAGVVMLFFAGKGGFDPVAFAWLLLPTFLLWMVVATRAGRAYAAALVDALRGRLVQGEALELRDEASRHVLESTLESERPADVLFALHLLERSSPDRAVRALESLVVHQAPAVRQAAFGRLEQLRDPSHAGLVAHRLQAEEVPEVRASALSCLVALQGGEAAPLVSRFLADPDARVRTAALAGLVRGDDRPGAPWRTELRRRADSPLADDRLDAARVIATAASGTFDEPLLVLLDDDDRTVRVAALQAAARAGGPNVWPAVIASLTDRRSTGSATAALLAGGEAVVPHLGPAFDAHADPYVQARLLRVAAARGAMALVRSRLASPEAEVRQAALEALAAAGHRFPPAERAWVLAELQAEAQRAAHALAVAGGLALGPDLLLGALVREADLARERALLWLSGIHDPAVVARAREGLKHPAREKRALALEVLDVTLAPEEKALVMPLCADGQARRKALAALFPPDEKGDVGLGSLLEPGTGVRPFTRAAALYYAARHRLVSLQPEVGAVLKEGPAPLVLKTAAFARAVLAGETSFEQKGRRMLTIEKVITLKAARMFAEASDEVLAEVAAIVEEATANAGEAVFAKGDAGDSMYIIAAGRMRVADGERTVSELLPGDVFGELALLDPEPRLFTVEALEDSRLLRLDREAFLELMAGNIEIVRGVLHVLCVRLRQAKLEMATERS